MKIVSTFHPSSSVLSSVKCRLGARDLEHLVVAKINRLDVYSLRPHGLQHQCGVNIWGKVCSVRSILVSSNEARSNIAVMLTHPDPELIILEYLEPEKGVSELIVKKQLSLFERLPRTAEFFTDVLVHPSGKLAVASYFAGKLKIITLKGGNYTGDFDVSCPEINVLSLCFLPTSEDKYTLGILHIDSQNRLQLCARDIDVGNVELSTQLSTSLLPTLIPERVVPFPSEFPPQLIPVERNGFTEDEGLDPTFSGGVMVVGGRQLLLFEIASMESQSKQRGKQKRLESKLQSTDSAESTQAKAKAQERAFRKRKAKASVDWPWNAVNTWCAIDDVPSRFLISDAFGRLSMISLENLNQLGMILVPLGEISSPTTLSYLTNQTLYVGSHLGDSQLVQISPTPISTQDLSILAIPADIKTVSANSLMAAASQKGKEKAGLQDDMDVDEEDAGNYSKIGRIVEPQGSYLSILESYKNIAPIMDAISVDIDGNGQNQIITCSGGANTGSVNVVRNGADFKESAFVQGLINVTEIWSMRTMYDDLTNTHLLVSTINESHLFRISDSGNTVTLQHEDSAPPSEFITNQPTLAFSNVLARHNNVYTNSRLIVQVVPTGAYLFEWDITLKVYMQRASWESESMPPPNARPLEIVAANVNSSQIALALSGGSIVLFCIENNANKFKILLKHETHSEISAISLMPPNAQKEFSSILSVAYWESNIVELFTLANGTITSTASTRSLPLPAVVRSLLLYNFGTDTSPKRPDYHAYLLAGLGDGSVASLSWKGGFLKDLKITSLGHAPVSLTPCEVDGRKSIFAAGNRASIFFCEKNRLANSPIMLKDISAVSKLNTRTFTSALILATPTGLSIGTIRNLNKIHIRSTLLGLDNPRKIIYEPSLKAFGVACWRVEPTRIGSYEAARSTFHLIDDNSLSNLGRYKTEPNEEITSILSFKAVVDNQEKPFFCLGTVIYKEEELEPTSGRLLIFTAHTSTTATKMSSLELSLVTSSEVTGCVYALKEVEGQLVAAVNSSILLYRFDVSSEDSHCPTYSLKKVADWHHNYLVTSLGSFNNHIVAGDQISSVSLLKVNGKSISLEAKDYTPLYPISVEALDTSNIIASNDALNLVMFTLSRNLRGEALESVGYFYLGDMVSKLVRGSLSNSDQIKDSKFKPQMIYFTSSGRIGIISDVEDEVLSLYLTELQRNLAAAISGVGGASHSRFRAPKNTRGPSDADGAAYGFLDGDFLEQFVTIQGAPRLLAKVMKGGSEPEKLKLSEEEILKIIEQLQSLH